VLNSLPRNASKGRADTLEAGWAGSLKIFKGQGLKFELDPLFSWEPMEVVTRHWGDVHVLLIRVTSHDSDNAPGMRIHRQLVI
jgi:hypothetical protein